VRTLQLAAGVLTQLVFSKTPLVRLHLLSHCSTGVYFFLNLDIYISYNVKRWHKKMANQRNNFIVKCP